MKRIASYAALVATFPSVDPRNLALIRETWRADARRLLEIMLEHAPKTEAWVKSCFNPPRRYEIRQRVCDELLDTHGVEYLGQHRKTGLDVCYCNAGDTYAATLIFHGDNAYLGCWGDLVERNAIKERGSL